MTTTVIHYVIQQIWGQFHKADKNILNAEMTPLINAVIFFQYRNIYVLANMPLSKYITLKSTLKKIK